MQNEMMITHNPMHQCLEEVFGAHEEIDHLVDGERAATVVVEEGVQSLELFDVKLLKAAPRCARSTKSVPGHISQKSAQIRILPTSREAKGGVALSHKPRRGKEGERRNGAGVRVGLGRGAGCDVESGPCSRFAGGRTRIHGQEYRA